MVKSFFGTVLSTPTEKSRQTQDTWGNLRIPMIEAFDGYGNHDWISLSPDMNYTFSSMVGVPFSTSLQLGRSNFMFNTSDMVLECPESQIFSPYDDAPCPYTNFSDPQTSPILTHPNNTWYHSGVMGGLDHDIVASNGFQLAMSSCTRDCVCDDGCSDGVGRRLIWESCSFAGVAHIDCHLRTRYVGVNYTCTSSRSCQSNSIRLSPDPRSGSNLTALDMGGDDQKSFTFEILKHLTDLYELPGSRFMPPIVGYLFSPEQALITTVFNYSKSVIDIPVTDFEVRLGQLFNTMYIMGISPHTVSGYLRADAGMYNPSSQNIRIDNSTTTSEVINEQSVIQYSTAWLVVLLLASVAALAAGLVSVVLKILVPIPDVLGSISVVTMDNKCNNVASGGSTLDSMERARLLKDVEIKLGDVEPAAADGCIALVAPLDGAIVGALGRDRMYV